MRAVFEEAKTPHKYGVILRGDEGKAVDCPSVFRHADSWFMVYVCMNKVGYETHLARSEDLLKWEPLGKILAFRDSGWDNGKLAAPSRCRTTRGAVRDSATFNNRYWLSYLGGDAKATKPTRSQLEWHQPKSQTKPCVGPLRENLSSPRFSLMCATSRRPRSTAAT
jgi:hypothetical protein